MNYRPEGWENPYNFMTGGVIPGYEKQSQAYELGAGDVVEALKKISLYGEIGKDYLISTQIKVDDPDWAEPFYDSVNGKGYLVFIPEES